jgi:MFS family permease
VALGQQLDQSRRAAREVLANRQLRNLQLAGLGSTLGTWAYGVALPVYAFHAGGAKTVGIIYFARFATAAVCAPWLSLLADRWSRRQVMLWADVTRIGLVGGMAALAFLHAPSLPVFVLAVCSTAVSSSFVPAQAALLPSLVNSPEELTSANVVMNTIGSVSMFAGPALGGVLLALSGPAAVFTANAAAFVWSAALVFRVRRDRRPEGAEHARVLPALAGGFRAVWQEPNLRLIVGLTGAQTLVAGAFQVLMIVYALRLIEAGNAGVGWLTAALGGGTLAGAVAVAALAGRKRLAGDFGIGVLLWGAPIALLAAWANLPYAIVLIGVIGLGNTILDVSGMTLLQRSTDDAVLGRVFGVLESLILATLAIGSIAAPGIVSALGVRGALVAVGVFPVVLLVPLWQRLQKIDRASAVAAAPLALLRRIPIFAPLPVPSLERLASLAAAVTVPAGEPVFSQGEHGDRFYAIESGHAAVEVEGAPARTLGAGDSFGEIALLRDVPRTATVRAVEDLRLYAVERDDFIGVVTGHAPSLEAAESVVATRLPAGAAI